LLESSPVATAAIMMTRSFLLQLLVLVGFVASLVRADDLLQLVLQGNKTAVDKALADKSTILQTFSEKEGSGYVPLALGQQASVRRWLQNGEEHEMEAEEAQQMRRKLIYCGYCGGCAGCTWCSRCGRRRSMLAAATNKQRSIESDLSLDLTASYCDGDSSCSVKAVINRIQSDGTTARAT
jgi:hypothetical protein